MHGHKNLPWKQYGQCHFLLNTRTRPGPGGSVREAKFARRSNCQGNCTCGVRTQQLPAAPQRHAATSCEDVDDGQGWLAHSVAAAVDASPACPSQGNTETRRGKLTVSYTETSQPSRQTRCENLYREWCFQLWYHHVCVLFTAVFRSQLKELGSIWLFYEFDDMKMN